MEAFLEVPMWKRKQVILKCIEKTPENVDSWLFAVCRNQQKQRSREAVASSSFPAVRTVGAVANDRIVVYRPVAPRSATPGCSQADTIVRSACPSIVVSRNDWECKS